MQLANDSIGVSWSRQVLEKHPLSEIFEAIICLIDVYSLVTICGWKKAWRDTQAWDEITVWQWEPKLVQKVQQHCFVWICLDTKDMWLYLV